MELSGRPLFDNPVDDRLFVPRDEASRIEQNCRAGVNTLVLGARGSGKTSLLRNVLFHLREDEFPAVGVDAGPAEDPLALVRLIVAATGRFAPSTSSVSTLTVAGLSETGEILDLLRGLKGGDRELPATAILLDLPAAAAPYELFGRFRDEIWQLPFTWIVVAPEELRLELLTPPADAFFEDVVEIGAFEPEAQVELIRRRLGPGEKTPWTLAAGGKESPRRLLEIARESVRTGNSPEQGFRARVERETDVASLGRSASMLYAELENYGPASASDKELLERLGWSRQRAAQVFADLANAGFVESETRAGSNGRPRKVFVVSPLGER
jgi:Cdc6-like AAA superfamily ATPase